MISLSDFCTIPPVRVATLVLEHRKGRPPGGSLGWNWTATWRSAVRRSGDQLSVSEEVRVRLRGGWHVRCHTERSFAESGAGATAIRAQYIGAGSRELTLLSGVAGEIGFCDTGDRRTVRGHEASIRSAPGGTFTAWWLEGPEGSPCSQYAVIAAGLTADEFEEKLRSLR